MSLSEAEVESVLETINKRAGELRNLLITIGSIIIVIIPAIEYLGLDLAGVFEPDPEPEPLDCDADWNVQMTVFVVEQDINAQMEIRDFAFCNERLNDSLLFEWEHIDGNTSDYEEFSSENARNWASFSSVWTDMNEGEYLLTASIGEVATNKTVWVEGEETTVEYHYGCTDTNATNYDEDADHDDGSCEYEPEPEPEPENCTADFYEVDAWWSNNTTFTTLWDADWSCESEIEMRANVTVTNSTSGALVADSSRTFVTYYYDWDYHYINFTAPQGQDAFGPLDVRFELFVADELHDEREVEGVGE